MTELLTTDNSYVVTLSLKTDNVTLYSSHCMLYIRLLKGSISLDSIACYKKIGPKDSYIYCKWISRLDYS